MHTMKKAPHVNKQTHPLSIVKRDGSIVLFDKNKIIVAVKKAMQASGEFKDGSSEKIASPISRKLFMQKKSNPLFIPTVEGVQDMVESELMLQGFPATVGINRGLDFFCINNFLEIGLAIFSDEPSLNSPDACIAFFTATIILFLSNKTIEPSRLTMERG